MCPHTHTWLQHVDWMFIAVLGCDALTTTVQFIPHCLNSLWVPKTPKRITGLKLHKKMLVCLEQGITCDYRK